MDPLQVLPRNFKGSSKVPAERWLKNFFWFYLELFFWECTHMHLFMPTIDLTCAQTHAHLTRVCYSTSRSAFITPTHTQVAVYWRFGWWWHTHTHLLIAMSTFDCLHKHLFLVQAYRSVFLARLRRYTKLPHLFHQCATSLVSRDSRIADCTVRHLGVERPFFSISQVELTSLCTYRIWKTNFV